jgi:riboflavin synthase
MRTFLLPGPDRGQRWQVMFAGIVEEKGELRLFEKRAAAWRLAVDARLAAEGTSIGDSIAVNGCCLTVVARADDSLEFELLEESRRLTNIGATPPGGAINLERSLRPDGRLGGHFVTGHIDTLGTIDTLEKRGADVFLKVSMPARFGTMVVSKGSIAIDGVSLTVVDVGPDWFTVWLIPHTLAVTTLGARKAGDSVNLEFDLLAKYVARAVEATKGTGQ